MHDKIFQMYYFRLNLNELEITEDDLIYAAQKFVISYQQTQEKKCNVEFETPNLD